jgi:hypothetical protein
VDVSSVAGLFLSQIEERRKGGKSDFLRLMVQDTRGDQHLSGRVILSDKIGILKESQEIEATLLGMMVRKDSDID